MARLTPDDDHFADADDQHNFAARFHDHGIGVFPVDRQKKPMCRSWDDYQCSRDQTWRVQNYGVRLGLLVVVDTDNDQDETWAAANLPSTPFIVSTRRGKHRYYRRDNRDLPRFIYRDGHTIELKSHGQYVVGPGSIYHADDGKIYTYTPSSWSWRFEELPLFPADLLFDDRPVHESNGDFMLPDEIFEPQRHDTLHDLMRSLVARGIPRDAAVIRDANGVPDPYATALARR